MDIADYTLLMAMKRQLLQSYDQLRSAGFDNEEAAAIVEGGLKDTLQVVPIDRLWLNRHEAELPKVNA
jgi:hypothetical protein